MNAAQIAITKQRKEPTEYFVKFKFKKELEKCYMVFKKTTKAKRICFIPKKIIIESREIIKQKVSREGEVYEEKMVEYLLPKWYCESIGFKK